VLVSLDDGDEVEGEPRAWKRSGDRWVGGRAVTPRAWPGHLHRRLRGGQDLRRPPRSQARGLGSVTTVNWAVPSA